MWQYPTLPVPTGFKPVKCFTRLPLPIGAAHLLPNHPPHYWRPWRRRRWHQRSAAGAASAGRLGGVQTGACTAAKPLRLLGCIHASPAKLLQRGITACERREPIYNCFVDSVICCLAVKQSRLLVAHAVFAPCRQNCVPLYLPFLLLLERAVDRSIAFCMCMHISRA